MRQRDTSDAIFIRIRPPSTTVGTRSDIRRKMAARLTRADRVERLVEKTRNGV